MAKPKVLASDRLLIKKESTNLVVGISLALLSFLVLAAGTIFVWNRVRNEARRDNELNLKRGVETFQRQLDQEFLMISGILHATDGLFASGPVDQPKFVSFVDSIKVQERIKSIYGIAYHEVVAAAERPAFEREMRRTDPDFAIYPAGERSEYVVVKFSRILTEEDELPLGFDSGADAVRREALERARDTGQAALSGEIELITQPGRPAFIIYLPIYRQGITPLSGVEERRAALEGFAVAVYLKKEFFTDLLTRAEIAGLDVEIFDGEIAPENLYFDSNPETVEALAGLEPDSLGSQQLTSVMGQVWTVFFSFHPWQTASPVEYQLPNIVLITGLLISFLFFVLVLEMSTARGRAVGLAEKMTSELQKFKLATESASSHIIITDPDAKILYANPGATRITGYTQEELLGNNPRLWGKQMSLEFYQKMWRQIKEDKITFRAEMLNKRKNGELYTALVTISPILNESGELVGFVGLEDDITARVRAEEALKSSEERFKSMIEKSSDVVALINEKGEALYESPGVERILGYRPEELVGRSAFELVSPSELPRLKGLFGKLLETPMGTVSAQFRMQHKDGSWRWLEAVGTNALQLPSVKAIVANFRDITERKKIEEGLRLLAKSSLVINEAADFTGAVEKVLRTICQETSWVYGEAWIPEPDQGVLRLSPAWYGEEKQFGVLRQMDGQSFKPGEGLPGRVFASKQAEWLPDVSVNGRVFLRASEAMKAGLKAGLGIPIVAEGQVLAVLCFFAAEVREEDKILIEIVSSLGTQLGSVFKRKQAEDALRESEISYRGLFDSVAEAIYIQAPDGKFLDVNSGAVKMYGYPREWFIGKSPAEVSAPGKNDLKKVMQAVERAFAGEPQEFEFWGVRNTGEVFPKDVRLYKGKYFNEEVVVALATDITARKKAEEQINLQTKRLAEAKAKDEAILASIGEGVIALNKSGRILLANKVAAELLGYKEEEMVGRLYSQLWVVKDAAGKVVTERPAELVLSGKRALVATEDYFYTRRDGSVFPVFISLAQVTQDNRTIGAIMVFRDVTKERQIDQAKSEFVSLASHQLRTPLSVIRWYLEMLGEKVVPEKQPEASKYLTEIAEANQRMVRLVNALLNVSRIEMGTFAIGPEKVNLVEIGRSLIENQRQQLAGKRLEITEDYAHDLPTIVSDPGLVRIILDNLLTNSVRYTPDGGRVEISIKPDGEGILIAVKDTGYGIPANQQDKVFTRLFRADNVKKLGTDGTGLGLYIVKSVVTVLKGRIWFESEENKGSTFYVWLPLAGVEKREAPKHLE